jgi:hypothetical protein
VGGHHDWVTQLNFSPDSRFLVTGSYDHTAVIWDAVTGGHKRTLEGHDGPINGIAFSAADAGATLATSDTNGRVLWWTNEGKAAPPPDAERLAAFPASMRRPASITGAGMSLHDPRDGRVLVTMLPLSDNDISEGRAITADSRAIGAESRAISADSRAITAESRPIGAESRADGNEKATAKVLGSEWFVTTPEGYFDCSVNAARFIRWNVGGVLFPAQRYIRRFRRPDLVRQAMRDEKIDAAAMTAQDIPPVVRFSTPKNGDAVTTDEATVTLEVRHGAPVQEVELLVNGRPLPPEQARPISTQEQPAGAGADKLPPQLTRLTYRFPLPTVFSQIRLRATVYDNKGLGSDPAEITIERPNAQAVAGDLYILSVGVSDYKNADGARLKNLRYPSVDSLSVAKRLEAESGGIYRKTYVRTLTNDEATSDNLRAAFQWLQTSVRPGQLDTVVIFLSGHGLSLDGKYFYATTDIDLKSIEKTTFSGQELRRAVGGQLRARAVFLFVDTCHSGALGGRNDDLALEIGERVSLLASSGATEYSFESSAWGHGAFTLALLQGLSLEELARHELIYFDALAAFVPEKVGALLQEVGRNASEQAPCVPLGSLNSADAVASLKED